MTSTTSELAKQYSDSQKLAARVRINSKYTIAEVGWFPWIARQLPLQTGDRVLDIGCGPGWFWEAVVSVLPERLDLTLADLSPGMVQEGFRCKLSVNDICAIEKVQRRTGKSRCSRAAILIDL